MDSNGVGPNIWLGTSQDAQTPAWTAAECTSICDAMDACIGLVYLVDSEGARCVLFGPTLYGKVLPQQVAPNGGTWGHNTYGGSGPIADAGGGRPGSICFRKKSPAQGLSLRRRRPSQSASLPRPCTLFTY